MKETKSSNKKIHFPLATRIIAIIVAVLIAIGIIVPSVTSISIPSEKTSEEASSADSEADKYINDFNNAIQSVQDAYLREDYDSVISLGQAALKKYGETSDTLIFKRWLGLSYFEKNDLTTAEKYFNEILESSESLPEFNYLRGVCQMSNAQYEDAILDFSAALASDELMDESLYNRGLCYISVGNTDAAAADFQNILDRNQDQEMVNLVNELLQL